MQVSRKVALKIIYWNVVLAVTIVCLGAALYIRRIHRYDTLIVNVGREYGVDPRLIASVIWAESRFDPTALGQMNEAGLMQVTEAAGKEWAKAAAIESFSWIDLFNAEINVRAGTWYLGRAIRKWSDRPDPLPYALAEYNAGPANADRWAVHAKTPREFWNGITYPTTKRYVRDILKRYRGGV